MFKTEQLYPAVQGDENDPGFLQSLVAFFTKLWSPQTQSAEQLGWAYGYDEEGTLLAELGSGGANSTGSTKHIWLPTASGSMPIAAIVNGAKFAVHADHLNTPRRLTNQQGEVAWQWSYSAFGEERPTIAATRFAEEGTNSGSTNTAAVTYNLRFPGQFFDVESGLHYNYFRTYDARTGQYTQPDPIGLDGGWNRLGYVGSNPLSFIDPDGLQARPRPSPGGPIPGLPGPRPVDPFEPGGPTYTPRPSLPGWLKNWLPKSALEQCEQEAEEQLERDYAYCKALSATYGNDYRTRKACEENQFRKYVKRLQECKEQCK